MASQLELDDLRDRCGGKQRTMVRVLEAFVASSDEYVGKLQQAAIEADIERIAKTLHSVKGLLREIAAIESAAQVEDVERKLKANATVAVEDVESVAALICSAKAQAKEAEEELRRSL